MFRSPPRTPARPTVPAARSRVAALVLAAACVLATGCDKGVSFLRTNTPPTIELTSGPIDTLSSPLHWIVEIAWTAHDPDGSIDHFEYAVDPPTLKQARFALADTVWTNTTENRVTVRFRATVPDTLGFPGATASSFHVFVLRAVDNRGGRSPNIVRAFYATTVAPDAQITSPRPSALLEALVPVPFTVHWTSDDPDGEGDRRPAFHRVRFLDLADPEAQRFRYDPDSLLRLGAATDWMGWHVVAGDTTSFPIDTPPAGGEGLFAVVAVDAAGATTPYLTFDRNFLRYRTTLPDVEGPRIHIVSHFIDYTYPSGGWFLDPARQINVEIGPHPLEFHWDGIPAPGRRLHASRWMLDGDPLDDTPRLSPNDLAHWSEWLPPVSSAQLPALPVGVHLLYVELRDDFGDRSLAIIGLGVIVPTLERELLVVDDTRLEVDKFHTPGTPNTYTSPWPSATELDTFLFARGGYPWRGTKNPATGVISEPGLLAGYSRDSLGTRLGLENPASGVTLDRLSGYRHVLWIVDDRVAAFFGPPEQLLPITALEAMSGPGIPNTLSAYVMLGGQVWLAGGGAAFASLRRFDVGRNNEGASIVVSSQEGELGPGRLMYDIAHVRSSMNFTRTAHEPSRSGAAVGGWSGHGPSGTLAAPDYPKLPPVLRLRTPATDPMPPTRLASQTSLYYLTNTAKEFVLGPNIIVEDMDPDPEVARLESTLDTLYEAPNPLTPGANGPVMLYYHGRDNAPFVFTGFDLWTWKRADCQALVDFVLGDIWGLAKSGVASTPARMAKSAASRSAAVTPTRSVRR